MRRDLLWRTCHSDDAVLYGSPEEVERLEADPAFQQWRRQWAEARGQSQTDRPAVSSLASRDRR